MHYSHLQSKEKFSTKANIFCHLLPLSTSLFPLSTSHFPLPSPPFRKRIGSWSLVSFQCFALFREISAVLRLHNSTSRHPLSQRHQEIAKIKKCWRVGEGEITCRHNGHRQREQAPQPYLRRYGTQDGASR